MSDVEIRPTIADDLDALADVLVQVHAVDGYPVEGVEAPRTWVELNDPIGQWTALLGQRVVGHIAVLHPDAGDGAPHLLAEQSKIALAEIGVVARLFVSPTFRGQAIGRDLLDAAEAGACNSGFHLVLDVMTKDTAAIKLYKSRGWRILGEIEHLGAEGQLHKAFAMAVESPKHRG